LSDLIDRAFDVRSQPTWVQIGIGVAAAAVLVWYLVARSVARRHQEEAKRRAEENARRRNA
jgi:hypothetical protein